MLRTRLSLLVVTALRWLAVTTDVTVETVEARGLAVDRARVETLRRSLGEHLALYRRAAGVSQPELGQALGRTRSMVSKIEHGTRGMAEALWRIADEVCCAEGLWCPSTAR
jgi:DNA-binding XRE family transcriptional regulator